MNFKGLSFWLGQTNKDLAGEEPSARNGDKTFSSAALQSLRNRYDSYFGTRRTDYVIVFKREIPYSDNQDLRVESKVTVPELSDIDVTSKSWMEMMQFQIYR